MIKNLNEIFDIRSDGLCNSCSHTFEECLENGKALCKIETTEKEVNDEQEKPV